MNQVEKEIIDRKWKGRLNALRRDLRMVMADYIGTEDCSCCENTDEHAVAKAHIAKLLNVPKYDDGSGYNFPKFRESQ